MKEEERRSKEVTAVLLIALLIATLCSGIVGANPVVISYYATIQFDKSSYCPGDSITITVKFYSRGSEWDELVDPSSMTIVVQKPSGTIDVTDDFDRKSKGVYKLYSHCGDPGKRTVKVSAKIGGSSVSESKCFTVNVCGKLEIDVWTADASKTKTEFKPGDNVYIWVKTNRPVTIDLIVDIYYDTGAHTQKYLRNDRRLSESGKYHNVWDAGEPGRRVLTLKAWDDYGNYATDQWTFYVKEQKKPDLIIQDISWSPSSPKQGDTVTITVKIKNQGSGSAGSSRVNYYIDGSLVGYDSVPTLSAGSTSTQTFIWTANKCGNVQVKAVADANNAISESDEGNNERTETMSVTCPTLKPDLIIQDISWSPSSPKQGDTITFTVKIKNQGSGSAGSSRVNYYIDGSYVGYDSVPALSAGSTSTQTFTWTANKCGNVQVKAVADANNAVDPESDEGNNEGTGTVNVACKEAQVIIDDDTCVGYDVYVDGAYKLTDGDGDGYCTFSVAEGTHTIEISDNDCSASIMRNFEGTYTWNTMPDNWCKGNAAVKFRGVIVKETYPISFYNYKIKIDEILEDPAGVLSPGDEVWVWAHADGPAQVDFLSIDDHVEVYGTYDGELHREVKLETAGHYLKEGSQEPGIIYVDDNFIDDPPNHKWNSIQEGINDAEEGDTVFVYSGTYYSGKWYGPISITKNGLKLIGEDQDTTIIDGNGEGDVITVTSNNTLISNFTICNSRRHSGDGIRLGGSYNEISNNIISFNHYGISTSCSDYNIIRNNLISNNDYYGMLIWLSTNNTIIENTIVDNYIGIYTHGMFCYHSFYHNNFIDNEECQAEDIDWEENYWHNKEIMEGNYWSDYEVKYPDAKERRDHAGIWDIPYDIPYATEDNYPLVEPWGETEVSGLLISNYPELFKTNSYLVVGENAASIDVIGGIKLINELAYIGSSITNVFDTDAAGDTTHNIISVGGPMANSVTSELDDEMGISFSSDATKYTISISGWKSFDIPKSWKDSEDLAVIAVREIDGKNKMVIWGITGQGTWAACEFISDPNIRSQLKTNTAIVHWKDVDGLKTVTPVDVLELYDSNTINSKSAHLNLISTAIITPLSSSSASILSDDFNPIIIVGEAAMGKDMDGAMILSKNFGVCKTKCDDEIDKYMLNPGSWSQIDEAFFNRHNLVISVGGPIANKYTKKVDNVRGVTWQQNGNIFEISLDEKTFSKDTSRNDDDIAIIYRTGDETEGVVREVIVVWGSKQYGTKKACEYLSNQDFKSIGKLILKIDSGSINTDYVLTRDFEMKRITSESIRRYYAGVKEKNEVWTYFWNKFAPPNVAMGIIYELTGFGGYLDVLNVAKDLAYATSLVGYIEDSRDIWNIFSDLDTEDHVGTGVTGANSAALSHDLTEIRNTHNEGKTPNKDLLDDVYNRLDRFNKKTEEKYADRYRILQFNNFAMEFIDAERNYPNSK